MANEIITPAQFFNSVSDPEPEPGASATTDPEGKEPESQQEPEDAEAHGEQGAKDPDASSASGQDDKPEAGEPDEASKEKPASSTDDKEPVHEITIDGKVEKWSLSELKKSAERFGASTRRFQKASELTKEAEKRAAEAEHKIRDAQARLNHLLSTPDALLELEAHAPEVFRAAFDRYAQRVMDDQKLYESSPEAYQAALAARKQSSEVRRIQEDLRRQREELEREKKSSAESAQQEANRKTVEAFNRAATSALKLVGVPQELRSDRLLITELKEVVRKNWVDGITIKELENLVMESAREMIKDPSISRYVKNNTTASSTTTTTSDEPKNDKADADDKEKSKGVTVTKGSRTSPRRSQSEREYRKSYNAFWEE